MRKEVFSIKEQSITRISGLNKESDIFVFLVDKLEKNHTIASKIYNKTWDMISNNSINMTKIEKDVKKIVDTKWDELKVFVIKKFMFIDDLKLKTMCVKIMTTGIINEINENPQHYNQFLSQ